MACFQGRILEVSGLPMNSVESLNSVRQFSPFSSSRLTNIGIREHPAKLGFSNLRAFACTFAPAGRRAICRLPNLLRNNELKVLSTQKMDNLFSRFRGFFGTFSWVTPVV